MATNDARNFVAFATGKKRSGKSFLLARYASAFPRRFIVDVTGEFSGAYAGAYECMTYGQALDALDDCIGRPRWTVVACLAPADTVKLCAVLAPENNPRSGFAYAVGGLLLECGEVDTIAPNHGGISGAVRNLFQRGRHARVSVVCATQRPRDVHRVVTSQADVIACFRQHEPRDVEYLASITSDALSRRIAALDPFYHVQYLPSNGTAALVDPQGREVIKLDPYTGEAV